MRERITFDEIINDFGVVRAQNSHSYVHRIYFKHFEMEWSEWFSRKFNHQTYANHFERFNLWKSDTICSWCLWLKKSGFSQKMSHIHTCADHLPKSFHVFIPLILYVSLVHDLATNFAPAVELVSNSIISNEMVLSFNFTSTVRWNATH